MATEGAALLVGCTSRCPFAPHTSPPWPLLSCHIRTLQRSPRLSMSGKLNSSIWFLSNLLDLLDSFRARVPLSPFSPNRIKETLASVPAPATDSKVCGHEMPCHTGWNQPPNAQKWRHQRRLEHKHSWNTLTCIQGTDTVLLSTWIFAPNGFESKIQINSQNAVSSCSPSSVPTSLLSMFLFLKIFFKLNQRKKKCFLMYVLGKDALLSQSLFTWYCNSCPLLSTHVAEEKRYVVNFLDCWEFKATPLHTMNLQKF